MVRLNIHTRATFGLAPKRDWLAAVKPAGSRIRLCFLSGIYSLAPQSIWQAAT